MNVRAPRRLLALLAAAAVLVATWAGLAPDATAQSHEGVCRDATGVTVVVDFHELGGGVNVRCAPWSPGMTGFGALQAAGVTYQTTVRFPGFLCKIAGKPTSDRCIDTSPASAYWSYWIAARGGQWCYANWGAGNRQVPAGGVEAWSFSFERTASTAPPPRFGVPARIPGTSPPPLADGDCDRSAAAPSAPRATPPTPAPPRPTAPAPATAPPAVPAATAAPVPPASAAPGPSGGEPSNGPSVTTELPAGAPDDSTQPDPAAEDADVLDREATNDERVGNDDRAGTDGADQSEQGLGTVDLSSDESAPSGSPVGVLVALLIVVVLGGGAFVFTRRRAADAG